jgi:hypothetical protein
MNYLVASLIGMPVRPQVPERYKIDPEQMTQKVILGLARWARKRMGKKFDAYLRQSREKFLLGVSAKSKGLENDDLWIRFCVQREPIEFPATLRQKQRLTFYKVVPQIRNEYPNLLHKIQLIKRRKRWNKATLRMELARTLSGAWIKPETIRRYAQPSMRASDVAYDYLAGKYRLKSGWALRKSLATSRIMADAFPKLPELDKWLYSSEGEGILTRTGSRFPESRRIEKELVKSP